jgi:hypothetical protein
MGEIIRFRRRRHARASSGRGTSRGQSRSTGQCSENHDITSSYFRAVNVLPDCSSRSKKRQSPAARRPNVAKLTERADAYDAAQAMRFERSSDSMGRDDSRTFPTSQEEKVGNFPLAFVHSASDKSDMPTADQVRRTIQTALERAGEGPVTVALELELERNYLRDYLEGKKNSIKPEVVYALSERYGIPFKELLVIKERPARRRA